MNLRILSILAGLAVALPAAAYRTDTHELLEVSAANGSQLQARIPELGASLGIHRLDSRFTAGAFTFGGFVFGRPMTPISQMRLGVVEEDATFGETPARYRFHFFNPMAPGNEGLNGARNSRDWGLEQTEIADQNYSLRDAATYLRQGIVAPTETERRRNLQNLFRTLGQVTHLIQDLGQPQHTRNDNHMWGSDFEDYAIDNPAAVTSAGYASVKLAEPADFWREPGGVRGFATYSNRGFVTVNTQFRARQLPGNVIEFDPVQPFGSPVPTPADVKRYQAIDLLGAAQPLRGEMWFVEMPVPDSVLGTSNTVKLSTFSLFDVDLPRRGRDLTFNLNDIVYAETQALLGARSAGYSSGIIDHLLRGKLTVLPPPSGVYAWDDHATSAGFQTMRARIRNDTPNEKLDGGSVVAVLKYHRNGCYKPDLSGEFTSGGPGAPPVAACPDYRSAAESMLVSEPHTITLDSGVATEVLTFSFPAPLPMDATDVYMQVLYTGKVGTQQEGFAFGMQDLSEPTFLAIFNGTDAFSIPGGFFYSEEIRDNVANAPYSVVDTNGNRTYESPPDVDVFGADMRYEITIADSPPLVARIDPVPRGRFGRLALITGQTPITYSLRSNGAGFNQVSNFTLRGKTSQLNAEGSYVVSTVGKTRGTPQWFSVVSYRFYPTSTNDLETFPASRDPDGAKPVESDVDDGNPM